MTGFAHLEGGARGFAVCKRGMCSHSVTVTLCLVSYASVEVKNRVLIQQTEINHVPTIITHTLLGGVRLGGKGLVGLTGCRQGCDGHAGRGWKGVNWPYRVCDGVHGKQRYPSAAPPPEFRGGFTCLDLPDIDIHL
eukprot:8020765-Pyramimonas_sp.AAC.1